MRVGAGGLVVRETNPMIRELELSFPNPEPVRRKEEMEPELSINDE